MPPRGVTSLTQKGFRPGLSRRYFAIMYYSAFPKGSSNKPILRVLTDSPPLRLLCSLQL